MVLTHSDDDSLRDWVAQHRRGVRADGCWLQHGVRHSRLSRRSRRVEAAAIDAFAAPRCETCGGLLKPDVVFFGENVPAPRYEQACDALAGADALLVAGSSLMVFSGYRFVRLAHEAGLPIAIVNRGRTRGDDLAEIKIEGDIGSGPE